MQQAVSCELLLYADDTCLICIGKDIKTIEDQLNKDFSSLCEWFIDNNCKHTLWRTENQINSFRYHPKTKKFTKS